MTRNLCNFCSDRDKVSFRVFIINFKNSFSCISCRTNLLTNFATLKTPSVEIENSEKYLVFSSELLKYLVVSQKSVAQVLGKCKVKEISKDFPTIKVWNILSIFCLVVLRNRDLSSWHWKVNRFLGFKFWKVFFQYVFEANLWVWNAGQVWIHSNSHDVPSLSFSPESCYLETPHWCVTYFHGGAFFQQLHDIVL